MQEPTQRPTGSNPAFLTSRNSLTEKSEVNTPPGVVLAPQPLQPLECMLRKIVHVASHQMPPSRSFRL